MVEDHHALSRKQFNTSFVSNSQLSNQANYSNSERINEGEGNIRTLQSRVFDPNNDIRLIGVRRVTYEKLIKNKDNSYTLARDDRIFISDSGYMKITYIVCNYSARPIIMTHYWLILNNGISLLTSMTSGEHSIIINGTQKNITFFDELEVFGEYLLIIYIKYSALYPSKTNLNPTPPARRIMVEGLVFAYYYKTVTNPYTNVYINYPYDGLSKREKIEMNISLKEQTSQYFTLRFSMEFIFVPKLSNYRYYYFNIIRTKLLKENEEEVWESIACEPYNYDEYEYEMKDCGMSDISDCSYYYRLELYLDRMNSNCNNGYLGSSEIIKFPIDKEIPVIDIPEEPIVTLPLPQNRFPVVPIVCVIIGVGILIGLGSWVFYRLNVLWKRQYAQCHEVKVNHSEDSQTKTGGT